MAPKCWAAVYGRPAPPPRAKKSEAAILVVSARDGAARRLVLVANTYVQPRGRADVFEVTAGCCGRARHHRLRIRDFAPLEENGTARSVPGPVRLHSSRGGQQGGCADVLWAEEGTATTCGDNGTATMAEVWRKEFGVQKNSSFSGNCGRCAAELQIPPSTSHNSWGELWLVLGGF